MPHWVPHLDSTNSPWFPSIPAIACGAGLFSFTITGVPDKDVNIPIADDDDKNSRDGNNKEKDLVSLQLIRDNNRFRIFDDDVQGQIAVGEKNIERQKWKDFEVEDLFNTCRTLAYSSSPDVNKNIKTPLPTLVLSDDGVPITPLLQHLQLIETATIILMDHLFGCYNGLSLYFPILPNFYNGLSLAINT